MSNVRGIPTRTAPKLRLVPAEPTESARSVVYIHERVLEEIVGRAFGTLRGILHRNGASIVRDADANAPIIGAFAQGESPRANPVGVWLDTATRTVWLGADGRPAREAELRTYSDEETFARVQGLLGVQTLSGKRVVVVGAGSVGGPVAHYLVRSGLGAISLWDPDIVEPPNLCRTIYGATDLGADKVAALATQLSRVSPNCSISTHAIDVMATDSGFEADVLRSDLVICASDGVGSRRFVNGVATALGVPIVTIGFQARAEVAEVIFVVPNETPCFSCVHPMEGDDDAGRPEIAYADDPDSASTQGLVADIALGNAIGAQVALALLDPASGRLAELDPNANQLAASSGRLPDVPEADDEESPFFDAAFQTLRVRTTRRPECPHCGVSADAVEYRRVVSERAHTPVTE